MGSAPGQPAVLQDKNLVCVEYRGDALGNDDLGGVRKAFCQPFPDLCLSGSIHSAGGIVQDQNFGGF